MKTKLSGGTKVVKGNVSLTSSDVTFCSSFTTDIYDTKKVKK